jgi:hypothetical protein
MKSRTRSRQTRWLWNGPCGAKPKSCITKLCLHSVRYFAAYSNHFALTFRDNLSVPASRIKKSKRENTAWGKLTDTTPFGGGDFVHCLIFLQRPDILEACSISVFQAKKHPTWLTPYIELFSFNGRHRNNNLLRHATENRSSRRAVIGK